ncbi:UNKNOWN [Stylonychia lemnae]|uniref:Uncharacterized protein n=1 Tax=Stylonychia lemnae TaxID=5949 RepID=A0A077ZQ72_STYLE|nr:UNKNOWN [Stylonychia lemnae]|eukprot:CDW72077.1 UNKNOWN [Stylonychia lemnae]
MHFRYQKDLQPSLLQRIKDSSSGLNTQKYSRTILEPSQVSSYPSGNSSQLEQYSNNFMNTQGNQTFLQQSQDYLVQLSEYLRKIDQELKLIEDRHANNKFEEGDPIEIVEGGYTNYNAREIIIQTDDPRDQMIENLLKNNKEIRQSVEEISRFTVQAVQKLSKRTNKYEEEKKIPRDPEVENLDGLIEQNHNQGLQLKEQLKRLSDRMEKLTNSERLNEFMNVITDNQRQSQVLQEKVQQLEKQVKQQQELLGQPNPIKEQITQEEDQLRREIKLMKKRFRQLDKSNREEIKQNQQDHGNIYNVSKQIERLKTHLSLIKTNRTIIQNNSQPNLNSINNNGGTTSNYNSQIEQNLRNYTNRIENMIDYNKTGDKKGPDTKIQDTESDIAKAKKLIQFKRKMIENEGKMYSQKIKQQETQYNKSVKQIQDTEEIIQLKNEENQKLADEIKRLQECLDPDILKILLMQNTLMQNQTERGSNLQQSLTLNTGSQLNIVRSYANLSAKKKLISTEENIFEKKQVNQEKTIATSKINQSLKLDSINDQFRSTTEQTSTTIVPSSKNQNIYKSMNVGKRLQNLKQLAKEERKSNNTQNTNQNERDAINLRSAQRSRSNTNQVNNTNINHRFRNVLNNDNDESFEEAKQLDLDPLAIEQLRTQLINNRIGVQQNRLPDKIVLIDKVNGRVQLGQHIQ